jgi:hypothetical protein
MSREEEYRRKAADTIGLANHATTTTDKGRLLGLAERWLDLADRARRLSDRPKPPIGDHPLVSQVFGNFPRFDSDQN